MTANQIAFYQAQETRRANLAKEGIEQGKLGESTRHNLQQENIGYATVGESRRHNQASEGIDFYKASNLANLQLAQTNKTNSEVGVAAGQLAESQRSAMEREKQQQAALDETKRHNVVSEGVNIFDAGVRAGGAIISNFMKLIPIVGVMK